MPPPPKSVSYKMSILDVDKIFIRLYIKIWKKGFIILENSCWAIDSIRASKRNPYYNEIQGKRSFIIPRLLPSGFHIRKSYVFIALFYPITKFVGLLFVKWHGKNDNILYLRRRRRSWMPFYLILTLSRKGETFYVQLFLIKISLSLSVLFS